MERSLGQAEVERVELPGVDLSGEELTVRVIPIHADEFTAQIALPPRAGFIMCRIGRVAGLVHVTGDATAGRGRRPAT
ncbi:DUF4193 family protein [Rhodococcus sp. USK13]|uniref:DUF4193 family protein n=1 Tax=Rhodococcus sp. USK13 TaxID=2806442 RepID=UPI0020165180|nr:DUF4193 family protein [Rhodococcus sp. USK13]